MNVRLPSLIVLSGPPQIYHSVLYLVVLLPGISDGIRCSPSLWGRFISSY